jgi:hypothetical protein
MDFDQGVLYRLAFGLAFDLAEADRENFPGRWRSSAAAGGPVEAILAEVLRRPETGQGSGREIIREAVEDAVEGRRPRW